MEMVGLPAYLLNRHRPCSTLQIGQLLVLAARLTSQTPLTVSIGYTLPSELSSNRRSLSTELFTRLRFGKSLVWSVQPRCRDAVSQSTSVVNFRSTYCPPVVSCYSWRTINLLLLARSYATVFRMTLYLLRHWRCFDENWKHIYFDSHIRTLSRGLFVVVLAMVVLAVIHLDHLKVVM